MPQLTVEENLFLGAELDRPWLSRQARCVAKASAILDRLGFPLNPAETRRSYLSRAEQQMVEIAKAFRTEPSVLILDEPTASLTERETEQLFALIEQAKRQGVGIIYITHRMSEISRIGDRITVLRDGRTCRDARCRRGTSEDAAGRADDRPRDQRRSFRTSRYRPGRTVLEVEGLTTATGSVRDVSIEVRAGEIVGIAGLVGSGKSEMARACFGLEPIASGRVRFDGEDVTGLPPRLMLDAASSICRPTAARKGW